jgi:inhibitor of KinA
LSVYIDHPKFLTAGESCVVAEFADEIDRSANIAVMRLKERLEAEGLAGVIECLPTYRSLAIYFDPLTVSRAEIVRIAKKSCCAVAESAGSYKVMSIPVAYGGEYGPDLESVAEHCGIAPEEVVRRHTGKVCHCYMIGFVPGFAYLGGMDESIAAPRLEVPRKVIPAGSVGIAGKQTGIYPIESPGGWRLIGRTPLKLFTPQANQPTLIKAGYGIRFKPVSADEYAKIESDAEKGLYEPEIITEAG